MTVQPMNATKLQAQQALKEYRAHRSVYDKRDWEIEKIYRAIARGKVVISVQDAIVKAGFDDRNRPRLAVCRADDSACRCAVDNGRVRFTDERQGWNSRRVIQIEWPNAVYRPGSYWTARAPRIPPQYRPATAALKNYHLLWEADWTAIPRDPYLLRRIGKDAWVVLAAWDLSDVEVSVLRAHEVRQ